MSKITVYHYTVKPALGPACVKNNDWWGVHQDSSTLTYLPSSRLVNCVDCRNTLLFKDNKIRLELEFDGDFSAFAEYLAKTYFDYDNQNSDIYRRDVRKLLTRQLREASSVSP